MIKLWAVRVWCFQSAASLPAYFGSSRGRADGLRCGANSALGCRPSRGAGRDVIPC